LSLVFLLSLGAAAPLDPRARLRYHKER